MKKKIILLCICFIGLAKCDARTTKGTEFWIAFMENLSLASNGPPKFTFQITSDIPTSGTVSIPNTGLSIPFTVVPNQATLVDMPTGIFYPQGDEAISNSGIKITSLDPIEVYAFHFRTYFTESSIVLPVSEIGTDYIVVAHKDTSGVSPSEFVVLATEDSTIIEITPSVYTLSGRPPGLPFTVSLMKGQIYQLQAYEDLTGTSVKSLSQQKKIAMFGGARQATVGCGSWADNQLYDQLYQTISWGTSYNFIPFLNHLGDVFKIVASVDSTIVTSGNGNTYNLNKFQYINLFFDTVEFISSNYPIAVAQLSTSQNCNGGGPFADIGDPTMIILTPYYLTKNKATFYTPTSYIGGALPNYFATHYLNIVTLTNAVNAITLDNNSIAVSFNPLPTLPGYSYARLTLDTLGQLQHTLQSDSGFSATIYALPYVNAYGHNLGFDEDISTGLIEYQNDFNINIFPNPVSDLLYIKSPKKVQSILIYDCMGKQVFISTGDVNTKIDVSSLSRGIYFIKLKFYDELLKPKMVKFCK